MKKFKKLIPALCMLLVSAVLLGSSTYAWFSMNDTVSANGMKVEAKTNTQFLLISNSATDITSDAGTYSTTSVNITQTAGGIGSTLTDKKQIVYPAARATEANKPVTGLNVGDWYTGNSTSMDNAGSVNDPDSTFTNGRKIDTDKLGDYVLTYTCYIGLAKGSSPYTGKLTVTGTGEGFDNGVTAIIKVGDENEIICTKNSLNDTSITNLSLAANTAVTVTVQIYIDGNNAAVKTQGFISLTGRLNLTFAIDYKVA